MDALVDSTTCSNRGWQNGVPADRLLVYQVSEGWGPLCEFLGVPAPDEEFPRLNESASFADLAEHLHAERARLWAEE
jgi:hypothetical protein